MIQYQKLTNHNFVISELFAKKVCLKSIIFMVCLSYSFSLTITEFENKKLENGYF